MQLHLQGTDALGLSNDKYLLLLLQFVNYLRILMY